MSDTIDTWISAVRSDRTLTPAALKVAGVLAERFRACPNLVKSAKILVDEAGCVDERGPRSAPRTWMALP